LSADDHLFQDFDYAPQRIASQENLYIPLSGELKIEAPKGGVHGVYLWERLINGVWTNVNSLNEASQANIFTIQNVDESWAGTYRYTVTNTWVPDLTFESGPIEVQI